MSRRLVFAMVFALATLPASAIAQKGTHYTCTHRTGLPRSPKSVIYTTGIFPMNASYFDILKAWQAYVVANIDPNATGNAAAECYSGTEASVGQSVQSLLPIWGKHVETGWQYKGSMTAMASKPGAIYAYCMSGDFGGEKTVYETPVFEVPLEDANSTNSPVEVTYAKYLIKKGLAKYQFWQWYSKSVGCPHGLESKQDGEARRLKAEAEYKRLGRTVVQTGWLYARNADTPPSNASSNSH